MLLTFTVKATKLTMQTIEDIYGALRGAVEKTVGRAMMTTSDFDLLTASLQESTKVNISAMTLKRFWGYLARRT